MSKDVEILISFALGDEHVESLVARFPHVKFRYVPCHNRKEMLAQLGDAEVLIGYYYLPSVPELHPNLRWIQLTGAGYDHLLQEAILTSGITVTNAPLFAIPISEYVLSSILSLSRQLPAFDADFRLNRKWPSDSWATHRGSELFGRTLGVVGYGSIGEAVAKLGQAFGMKVIATRQSTVTPTTMDGVQILPASQLRELLHASDFVVLSLPLTPQSQRLMGREQFQQMKAGAYLINIARGAIVDETALINALQSGHLGGAALDVFDEEPLSPSSPLFDLPNVLLTPHIAGITSAYHARATEYFAQNLERYLNGDTLMNVISKSNKCG